VPTTLEFNDDILSVEYESFSCGLDVNESFDGSFCIEYESFSFDPLIPLDPFPIEFDSFSFDVPVGLDVDMCVDCESFSFHPIQANLLFESHKSKVVESESFIPMVTNFDQPPTHIDLKGLVDLGPSDFPRSFVQDNHISRLMTSTLGTFTYVCQFPNWVHQFDKLKRSLACAELQWWMYSFLFHLVDVSCFHLLGSWSCLYDKLLRTLIGFDLNNSLCVMME